MEMHQIIPADVASMSLYDAYREYFTKVPLALHHHLQKMDWSGWQANDALWQQLVWTPNETKALFVATVGLLVVRYTLTVAFFKPLARRLQLDTEHASRLPESCWKVVYYLLSWAYAFHLLHRTGRHNYMTDLTSAWTGITTGMDVPLEVYTLYMIQLGFYTSSVVTTFLFERERKDYYIMQTHHFVTICLISFSYAFRFHKIGLAVLYVHDLCDVLLDTAKIFNYCKKRNGKTYTTYGRLADFFFIMFLGSWVYFRFYLFVTRVLYSSAYVSLITVSDSVIFVGFNAFLHTLLLMHIYWFALALRVVVKVIKGEELEDVRDEETLKNHRAKQTDGTGHMTKSKAKKID
eukprot:comp13505_c0_seq1/m.9049 comp13505_c0_seq1/g.9049  ORF comp13505_c0_seq1/g.9049 comp13505_c0_seq1/m.9049 type:complete len:349 (-) comp13505_c0_seq1:225-1271(-)